MANLPAERENECQTLRLDAIADLLHCAAEESRENCGGGADALPKQKDEKRALAEILPCLADGRLPLPTDVEFDTAGLRLVYAQFHVILTRLPANEKRRYRKWSAAWYPSGTFVVLETYEFVFPGELDKIFTNVIVLADEVCTGNDATRSHSSPEVPALRPPDKKPTLEYSLEYPATATMVAFTEPAAAAASLGVRFSGVPRYLALAAVEELNRADAKAALALVSSMSQALEKPAHDMRLIQAATTLREIDQNPVGAAVPAPSQGCSHIACFTTHLLSRTACKNIRDAYFKWFTFYERSIGSSAGRFYILFAYPNSHFAFPDGTFRVHVDNLLVRGSLKHSWTGGDTLLTVDKASTRIPFFILFSGPAATLRRVESEVLSYFHRMLLEPAFHGSVSY